MARLLAAEPDFHLLRDVASGPELLQELRGEQVDLVLLDLDGDDQFYTAFMAGARAAGYTGYFLVVAGHADAALAAEALREGASGIFLKSGSSANLLHAIRMVASGEVWVTKELVRSLAERVPRLGGHRDPSLTAREQAILRGLIEGMTNKKIASSNGISESAVKATVRRLYAKTGVHRRSRLVRLALEGSLPPAAREAHSRSR